MATQRGLRKGVKHGRYSDQGWEDGTIVGQVEGDFDGILLGDELESRTVVPHVVPGHLVHSLLLLPATSGDAAVHDLDHEGTHDGGWWVRVLEWTTSFRDSEHGKLKIRMSQRGWTNFKSPKAFSSSLKIDVNVCLFKKVLEFQREKNEQQVFFLLFSFFQKSWQEIVRWVIVEHWSAETAAFEADLSTKVK